MGGILITGATGVIGRRLVERLRSEGRELTIAGRHNPFALPSENAPHIRFHPIQSLGPDTDWQPALEGVATIIHLAGQVPAPGLDEAAYDRINRQATGRLVEQAARAGVERIIFASSIFAVTGAANGGIVSDDAPPRPATTYGRSKLAAEALVSGFATGGRAAVSLRFPMIYGRSAGGNWNRLVRLAALPLPLPFRSAHNRRSILALDNAVDAICQADRLLTPEKSGVYAVTEGPPPSVREIVGLLRKSMQKPEWLFPLPPGVAKSVLRMLGRSAMADSLFGSLVVDGNRFAQVFDWKPPQDTETAIADPAGEATGGKSPGNGEAAGQSPAKRVLDLALALAGLIILSPVIVLVAVLVRATSPGPALFVQERVGRNETPFSCYKFRTMATGAPQAGSHEVSSSWITPLGRVLRRFKLDEMPQLINVLRGEMSLVGPRPCLPVQQAVIAARRKRGVFRVRPGITGPAQLRGLDMSKPEELAEADLAYIRNQGIWSDVALIVRTLFGSGRGDAAGDSPRD